MEGKRLPLTVVSNELKVNSLRHRYSTRSSASSNESCADCKTYTHKIEDLQGALSEVLDQNTALKSRVAELEAELNRIYDVITIERSGRNEGLKGRRLSS